MQSLRPSSGLIQQAQENDSKRRLRGRKIAINSLQRDLCSQTGRNRGREMSKASRLAEENKNPNGVTARKTQ